MPFATLIEKLRSATSGSRSRRARAKAAVRRRSKFFRPWMEVLEDRTVPSTVNWINSAGGDWDTASNWLDSSTNTNHTPGTIDDAVINTSGITVTHSSTSSVHNFTLSGATLSGAGSLVVNGQFTWAGTLTAG